MNGSAEFIPQRMVDRRDGGMNSALHASTFMESLFANLIEFTFKTTKVSGTRGKIAC